MNYGITFEFQCWPTVIVKLIFFSCDMIMVTIITIITMIIPVMTAAIALYLETSGLG